LAITDCLNFGNPQRPEILWQFEQACLGIGEACVALGTPVVSGNVSLYNETEGRAVFPTPTIGMVGLVEDCARHAQTGFTASGEVIALLGEPVATHLGGSEYLRTVHGKVQGMPPPLDYAREKAVQGAVRGLVRAGLVTSAHDLSDGGLAVALAEMCFPHDLGARVSLPAAPGRLDAQVFGEDAGRILIAFKAPRQAEVEALAKALGAPLTVLGTVGGESMRVESAGKVLLDAPASELKALWAGALAKVVGE
jgi:phosphoribosylformylglycinamidine synthase